MPEFQTYMCDQCGEEFVAVPGSNAAERSLCSPRCERRASEREEATADD